MNILAMRQEIALDGALGSRGAGRVLLRRRPEAISAATLRVRGPEPELKPSAHSLEPSADSEFN
jgi:hypothetical protein